MNQNILIYTPITDKNAIFVQVGEPVQFLYHGKRREGVVEKAGDFKLTLKYKDEHGEDAFKSFIYAKMGQ